MAGEELKVLRVEDRYICPSPRICPRISGGSPSAPKPLRTTVVECGLTTNRVGLASPVSRRQESSAPFPISSSLPRDPPRAPPKR
ncbi:hypothetical protein BDW66DRAFT_64218 [Aspergillus desertorum]